MDLLIGQAKQFFAKDCPILKKAYIDLYQSSKFNWLILKVAEKDGFAVVAAAAAAIAAAVVSGVEALAVEAGEPVLVAAATGSSRPPKVARTELTGGPSSSTQPKANKQQKHKQPKFNEKEREQEN